MAHVRKQIRQALVTLLTGLATTGARVQANRVFEIQSDGLPALNVVIGEEEIGRSSVGGPVQRMLTVTIEAYAKGAAGMDDFLDDMAAEIEAAIGANPMLGALLNMPLDPVGLTTRIDPIAEERVGRLSLDYVAGYRTDRTDPETSI